MTTLGRDNNKTQRDTPCVGRLGGGKQSFGMVRRLSQPPPCSLAGWSTLTHSGCCCCCCCCCYGAWLCLSSVNHTNKTCEIKKKKAPSQMFVEGLKEEQNRIYDMKLKSERGSSLLMLSWVLNVTCLLNNIWCRSGCFFLPWGQRANVWISEIKLEVI